MKKPPQYCPKCRVIHDGECPNKPKYGWSKKAGKGGRGGRPWQRKRKYIFERDNYLCQIHLKDNQIVPIDLHGHNHGVLDHIIPLSQGGSNDDSNLQTICQSCDKIKTSEESRYRG